MSVTVVLAAAGVRYNTVSEAIGRMVRPQRSFTPDPERVRRYGRLFARFCEEMESRGYG